MFTCFRRAQAVVNSLHCLRRIHGQPRRRADVIQAPQRKPREGIPFLVASSTEPIFGWNKRTFVVVTSITCVVISGLGYRMYKKNKRQRKREKIEEDLTAVKEVIGGDGLPRPLVLAGPPGAGKTTLVRKLIDEFPDAFGFCVWHTTREMRTGEVDGRDFHFITSEEMSLAKQNNVFLETATFNGIEYGTSKHAIADVKQGGRICVLDTSIEGVKVLKKTDLSPVFVYIKPPSLQILEERLSLNSENKDFVQKKVAEAKEVLASFPEKLFDFVIVNDDMEGAYKRLKTAISEDLELVSLTKKSKEKL